MTISTSTAAGSPAARRAPVGRAIESAARAHRSIPVLVVLAIIWAVFYSQSSAYLSFQNLTHLTLQIVTTAILALGVVFVLLVGEIDLSSAVLSGVCAAVAAGLAVNSGLPLPVALVAAVVLGMVVTFIEAQVIMFGVPSLIVTLGGVVILQGPILVVLPPEFTISVAATPFAEIASTTIPAGASYALAAAGTVAFAAYRLVQHRERLSTGSPTSAGATVASSLIVAAVLFGGRGSIWSALLGALVIGSISNGVQLLGLSTEVQYFATGSVLIIAVASDVVLARGSLLPGRR